MKDNQDTINCFGKDNFVNRGLWIANNCELCAKVNTDKCEYKNKRWKKNEPLLCDKLILKTNRRKEIS